MPWKISKKHLRICRLCKAAFEIDGFRTGPRKYCDRCQKPVARIQDERQQRQHYLRKPINLSQLLRLLGAKPAQHHWGGYFFAPIQHSPCDPIFERILKEGS